MVAVSEVLAELLDVEAHIDVLAARKTALRATLEAEARASMASTKAVPTWRSPGAGSVTLSGCTWAPHVSDPVAWRTWVAANHPTEAAMVLSLPVHAVAATPGALQAAIVLAQMVPGGTRSIEVAPAFLKALEKAARVQDTADPAVRRLVLVDEVVPGVEVTQGEGNLHVVLDKAARVRRVAELLPRYDEDDDEVVGNFGAGLDDLGAEEQQWAEANHG